MVHVLVIDEEVHQITKKVKSKRQDKNMNAIDSTEMKINNLFEWVFVGWNQRWGNSRKAKMILNLFLNFPQAKN